jgi:hypothetical protein
MDFCSYIQEHTVITIDEVIRLGPVSFRLLSNIPDFSASQYFSHAARNSPHGSPQFELWCVSLQRNNLDQTYLREHIDQTYRGTSFLNGYYIMDHFGPPIYLVTHGSRYYIFGEQLERVVWSYFVKHFLMIYAIQHRYLHLKAAAFAIGSAATLILGRSGAGKTVFLTQLCKRGARFMTNTHALLKEGYVQGVASSMRMGFTPWSTALIHTVSSRSAIKPEQSLIDPYEVFDSCDDGRVKVKNLCIIDFRGTKNRVLKRLTAQELYDRAEEFALAINVYHLEEDLLDFYDGNYQQFARAYGEMKMQLSDLIKQIQGYYISCDILDQKCQEEIFSLLSA